MSDTFGISEADQAILDRLKSNRDAKLSQESDKITPVIKYATPLTQEERKEKTRTNSKRFSQARRDREKNAISVKTSPQRCRMKPIISYDADGNAVLTWRRHFKNVLAVPEEIGFSGFLELRYNTKAKQLLVKQADDNPVGNV